MLFLWRYITYSLKITIVVNIPHDILSVEHVDGSKNGVVKILPKSMDSFNVWYDLTNTPLICSNIMQSYTERAVLVRSNGSEKKEGKLILDWIKYENKYSPSMQSSFHWCGSFLRLLARRQSSVGNSLAVRIDMA